MEQEQLGICVDKDRTSIFGKLLFLFLCINAYAYSYFIHSCVYTIAITHDYPEHSCLVWGKDRVSKRKVRPEEVYQF